MRKIRLSVIIPVYKAEPYIERCARSLMEQTMKDEIEFLFINDCTPDGSMEVLQRVIAEYPERKEQVRILNHTENKGIFITRQDGLNLATGEYIGWCDSDDWIEPTMYEKMLQATEGGTLDVVVCNYREYRVERTTDIRFASSNTPLDAFAKSYCNQSFAGTLWNQIIKKQFYDECWSKVFPTNYSEDTFVLMYIYSMASNYKVVDECLYHYDKRNVSSLMHTRQDSAELWQCQELNLKNMERLFYSLPDGYSLYHKALNNIIFERKNLFSASFYSAKDFFYTFRNASRDIVCFQGMTLANKLKIYLVNNIYPLFLLKCHNQFKNN